MSGDNLTAKLIADLRTRLLDLRNGNKLLNYKHSERAKTQARVVDELPDFLHDCLTSNKQLSFKPLPEPDSVLPDEQSDDFLFALEEARRVDKAWAGLLEEEEDIASDRAMKIDRQIRDRVRTQLDLPAARGGKLVAIADWARLNGIEPSFDLPMPDGEDEGKHRDSEIQTLLLPDELQGKLAGVIDHARTAQQEMGVNLLHMAIGFLEWFETPTAEKPMLAPLLLYPAELDRKPMKGKGQYRYFLRGEQDPIINITLRQRLANDYNLIVPELDEGDTAETYMDKMSNVIAELPRWRIRRFATLGLFSFSRLVMYNDIDPARWGGEEGLPEAGVLEALFGRREAGSSEAETYDIEDPDVEAEVPLLIRDADSSQHQAIIDVMRGKNLVIKGPPGTGKSQTIANIIAAALANRKSVLFVAEKAAALDVVKKRLDEAGLGEFCFELHSTKAKKLQILASLDRRLNLPAPPEASAVGAALTELRSLRDRLARHASTMNLPFSALEVRDRGQWRRTTIHDIFWAEQRSRAVSPRFIGVERAFLPNAMETSRFDAERRRDRLTAIERLVREFTETYGSVGQHPWSLVTRPDVQVLDVSDITDVAGKAALRLSALSDLVGDSGASLGGTELPGTLSEMTSFSQSLTELPVPEGVPDHLLRAALESEERANELMLVAEAIEDRRKESTAHAELLSDPSAERSVPTAEIDEIAEQARRAGLSDLTLDEIAAKAERSRKELASWKKLVGFARQILDLFGLHGADASPRVLRRTLDAVGLLASVERPALLSRIPSILDEAAHPILDKAKAKLAALREQDTVQRERFVIDASLSIVEIRKNAGTLKSTGLFGKRGGEFKAARKTCFAILKGDAAGGERRLAEMLIELADHLEAKQSFENDITLRTICAHRFYGLDTDIDALIAANQLATRVRAAFAGMSEPERSLRRFLIEADIEVLDAVKALADDPRLVDLRKAIATIDDQDASLDDLGARLEGIAVQAEAVHAALIGFGLRKDKTPNQAAALAGIHRRLRELDAALADGSSAALIGADIWKGALTDTGPIRAGIEVAEAIRAAGPQAALLDLFRRGPEPAGVAIVKAREAGIALQSATTAAVFALRAVLDRVVPSCSVELDATRFCLQEPISALTKRFRSASASPDELMRWVTLRRGISEAREDGLAVLLDAYDEAGEAYLDLVPSYDRILYRSLARRIMEIHPELGESSALSLDDIRTRFRDLDQRIMEMRLQALIADLAAAKIPQGIQSPRKGECTEATLVRNEIAKKKKHIPIRDLVERASNAIRAMKPCTMMSPPSVAQYLKPGQAFDIVIIDEASQMRPEEAISAMARARQAVVVGDPQQLPPSSFFDRQDSDGQDEDDEEFEKIVVESILDVARTAFQPPRELLWHYRSRHGSLIAFSNRHFYDDRLIVFPSPQEGHPDYGVRLVPVAGQYRASVNVPEVQAVAYAAADFMANHPEKSLGIVALNQPQRDLILAEMDRILVRDAIAERYRARWHGTLEPFFVKNLENVQGDERDVIFISTVYGPDERGTLMQRFGPINGAAGDRRLNVLFSRAKHGVTVFSSMRPDQIRADAASQRGTRLLKDYLEFAATGRLDSGHVPYKECDSDFERFVKERLESKGYEVVAQVGVAGFWIDLGIRHPDWPYGFLLGIECDGAAYHSSLSARDRDRLRQQILEGLGWTIYRVWSTDWFRDQNRELAKMIAFIEQALADRLVQQTEATARQAAFISAEAVEAENESEDEPWVEPALEIEDDEEEGKQPNGLSEDSAPVGFSAAEPADRTFQGSLGIDNPILGTYREASFDDLGLHLNKDRFFESDYEPTLAKLIERCVVVEGPIRDDVLARRVGSAHGFHKAGSRIRDHASSIARSLFKTSKEGDVTYFWPSGATPETWSTFRKSKGEPRPIDEIAIQELRALALLAMQDRRSATEDVLVIMSRIAGLQRLRAPSRERLALAQKKALAPVRMPASVTA